MTFVQNQAPTFIKQPQNGKVIANNTTNANIYTAGSNGSKVVSLIATTNSTSTVNCAIQVLNGSTLYTIGYVSIPASSGTNASNVPVNLFSATYMPVLPLDSDGNPYLFLISGDSLQISLSAAITGANAATFMAVVGDF